VEKELAAAQTDGERAQMAKETEAASELFADTSWTTTVVDITSSLHTTCKLVFFDQAVEKNVQGDRARAVAQLGKAWMDVPESDNHTENHKDSKHL